MAFNPTFEFRFPAPESLWNAMSTLPQSQENTDVYMQHMDLQEAEQERILSQDRRLELIARDLQVAPLFTHKTLQHFLYEDGANKHTAIFSQRGLLGIKEPLPVKEDDLISLDCDVQTDAPMSVEDDIVFANTREPWSAFICGSQGSGKSHTLACLLENYLLEQPPVSKLPDPLTAMVFHYDKFSSFGSSQICETAYLCSAGIKVRILVAPSSVMKMMDIYTRLPGLPDDCSRPEVLPLFFTEDQLTIDTIMTLMAVQDTTKAPPLYISALRQILRDMATTNQDRAGIDYREFRRRLQTKAFSRDQMMPLELRLQLLDSLLFEPSELNPWEFEKGTLTIVDLSDQFVSENDACALFSICLKLFMENRRMGPRVVAMDEAHKFLTKSCEAVKLTNDLISIIRQQRHLGTRVIIATQEPTQSPELLDLCNLSIIHRFNSPRWYDMIKNHLAGAYTASKAGRDLLYDIVALDTGEALLFCPTAVFDVKDDQYIKLRNTIVKINIRARLTTDGGCSILSSDIDLAPVSRAGYVLPTLRPFSLTNAAGVQMTTVPAKPPQQIKNSTQATVHPPSFVQSAARQIIKNAVQNDEKIWDFGVWRRMIREDLNAKRVKSNQPIFSKKHIKALITDKQIQNLIVRTCQELKRFPSPTTLKQHPWFYKEFQSSIAEK